MSYPYLRTLEGVQEEKKNSRLDDLFYTNDVLGCILYGPEGWNRVKSYACNVALQMLADRTGTAANVRKIAGRRVYKPTNDILDDAFGFNHQMGCELFGADDWDVFVRGCKMAAPQLGSVDIGGAFKSLIDPRGHLVPAGMSAGDIARWILAPGTQNLTNALSKLGYKSDAQKSAEKTLAQKTLEYEQSLAQAKQDFDVAYAAAKADAESEKELKYKLQTNPEYMANKTQNYIIIGGVVLLAAVLLTKR